MEHRPAFPEGDEPARRREAKPKVDEVNFPSDEAQA
jgi:hypothetical protein